MKNKNLSLMKDEHELNKIQMYYKIYDTNEKKANAFHSFLETIICCRNNNEKNIEASSIEVSMFGSEYELNIDEV